MKESIIIRKPEQLVRMLENRIITKDDLISFNAMGRRMDLKVIKFSPKADAIRIHLGTKISISEKKYKEIIEMDYLLICVYIFSDFIINIAIFTDHFWFRREKMQIISLIFI